eukprot:TRINITY_DN8025_c0_g1_i7.p1 TRINITY_DN8025_c0_g1~~TRINITY_DN8025_c0_g1_i7.p1  ORF type:complete len:182 (-),score=1.03 TRINITY_DN8025_c0_g1_i7:126-671(-)
MARYFATAATLLSILLLLVETSDSVTLDTATSIRWSANLRPWNQSDRQFRGNRYARGVFQYRLHRFPNGTYSGGISVILRNIKSSRKFPSFGIYKGTPQQTIQQATMEEPLVPMANVTRQGRFNKVLKRYSFVFGVPMTFTQANFDTVMKPRLKDASGYFIAVLDQNNNIMVRGQCHLHLK